MDNIRGHIHQQRIASTEINTFFLQKWVASSGLDHKGNR